MIKVKIISDGYGMHFAVLKITTTTKRTRAFSVDRKKAIKYYFLYFHNIHIC